MFLCQLTKEKIVTDEISSPCMKVCISEYNIINMYSFAGIAAQEGHELCVVALLEHGADPNHSDACGRNALRVAAKSGHRGVVRLLEEYNARSHKVAHTSSSANSITSGIYQKCKNYKISDIIVSLI